MKKGGEKKTKSKKTTEKKRGKKQGMEALEGVLFVVLFLKQNISLKKVQGKTDVLCFLFLFLTVKRVLATSVMKM